MSTEINPSSEKQPLRLTRRGFITGALASGAISSGLIGSVEIGRGIEDVREESDALVQFSRYVTPNGVSRFDILTSYPVVTEYAKKKFMIGGMYEIAALIMAFAAGIGFRPIYRSLMAQEELPLDEEWTDYVVEKAPEGDKVYKYDRTVIHNIGSVNEESIPPDESPFDCA